MINNRAIWVFSIGLAAVVLISGFWGLGGKSFWASHMESRRAEIAKQMVVTGDYIIPKVNGEKIFTKPPLFYWMIAASYKITGKINELSSRLPAIVFGFATLLLVFLVGAKVYDRETGLVAVAVLCTSYLFAHYTRLAELDIPFTFFISLSFYLLILLRAGDFSARPLGILFWIAVALGFMVKGPFALLFPLASYLALVAFEKEGKLAYVKKLFSPWGILVFLLIVLPWFIYVIFFDDAWVIFNEETLQRVTSSRGKNHSLFFYLASLSNFLPWAFLLPFALFWAFYRERKSGAMVISWFVSSIIVASIISAKNIHYILPLYPAMAIIVGRYIVAHIKEDLGEVRGLDVVTSWLGMLISFIVTAAFVAFPFAPLFTKEVPPINMPLSVLLIAVTSFLTWKTFQDMRSHKRGLLWLKVFSGLFILLMFTYAFAVPNLNSRNSHKNFIINVKRVISPETEIVMYNMENFQVPFYLDRNAPSLWGQKELESFSIKMRNRNNGYFVITRERDLNEAVDITNGRIFLEDDNFIAPSEKMEGERFILIKSGSS